MRQTLIIAFVACLMQETIAADFEVSGQQTIQMVSGSTTSAVMATIFTLTRVGTSWAIKISYSNMGARSVTQECIALVDGRSYTAEWYANGSSGGLVMDRLSDRLEAANEVVRVLVGAFLASKERLESVSNGPVGFLHPRHPGLYCYRQEVRWSSESPWVPEQVGFHLDDERCDQVPREAVSYFFRSGYRDQSLFRRWRETQKAGAEYSVSGWTNWGGLRIPQRATLTHTHFEPHSKEQSFPRLHVITVTDVRRPDSATLVPMLLPGSSVQEVAAGMNYLYTSIDGTFLPEGEAKSVGIRLTKSPLPGPVAVINRARAIPWPAVLLITAVLLVAGIAWRWFTTD